MALIEPRQIVPLSDSGVGTSMGDVTDTTSPARFWLETDFGVAFIRGRFTDGSGQDNLVVRVDSQLGTRHDYTLRTIENVGTDGRANVNFRISSSDLIHWVFTKGDVLVLEWTNPNTQVWGITVGLYDAS